MSPRVAYWCSSFDADIEAVASEVATLRQAFPGSITWGVAARDKIQLSLRDGIGLHPKFDWLFRALTWAMQGRFDVQHLFGGVGDWFHLRAVRRRPAVLTIAVQSALRREGSLLNKIDRFVVEWPAARQSLIDEGIERERIRIIYPPVDLKRFQPSPPPEGPFTVLFASSPDRADWLAARGVNLILDAAEAAPQVRFMLVWRPWGDSLPAVQSSIRERELSNVEIVVGRFADMAAQYRMAHITVAPFTDMARCKPAPNSIIESLAVGRPVIVTACVGISQLIEDAGAGLVCDCTGAALGESIASIAADWQAFSNRARQLAQRTFSTDNFVQSYRQLYEELV